MQNNWQTIWNKRSNQFSNIDLNNDEAVFMELTRLDGYDVGTAISYNLLSKSGVIPPYKPQILTIEIK